jgi:hypothetical protein
MNSSFSSMQPNRRQALFGLSALVLHGLSGCGGNAGGDLFGGSPGIGGTGFFSSGSISGFGSVIINGITFDDTNASVLLDGIPATNTDLRLGMVAEINGTRGTAAGTGVARHIAVWSIAQGVVSNVQPQSNQFTVDGMVIQTNTATVWEGVASTAQLLNGMRVTVWGLQNGAGLHHWTATRVALVTANTPIRGESDSMKPSIPSFLEEETEVDLEGFITALLSNQRFRVGNVEVDASQNPDTSQLFTALRIGERIHVDGYWKGNVLLAIEIHDSEGMDYDSAHLEGTVDQFTSIANFVVRGQRCDATNAEWEHGSPALLRQGVKVKLEGTKAGDVLMVTEIEIK